MVLKDEQGRTLNKDGSLRKPRTVKPKDVETLAFLTGVPEGGAVPPDECEFYIVPKATSVEQAANITASEYENGVTVFVVGPVKVRTFEVISTLTAKEVK